MNAHSDHDGEGEQPEAMDKDTGVLSVSRAAGQLGLAEKTVRRWIHTGKLRAEEVDGPYGRQWQITQAALDEARRTITLPTLVKVEHPTVTTIAEAVQKRIHENMVAMQEQIDQLTVALQENAEQRQQREAREEERDAHLLALLREVQALRQEQARRRWWKFW